MYKNHNTNYINCLMINLTKLKDVSAHSSKQMLFHFPPTILLDKQLHYIPTDVANIVTKILR